MGNWRSEGEKAEIARKVRRKVGDLWRLKEIGSGGTWRRSMKFWEY